MNALYTVLLANSALIDIVWTISGLVVVLGLGGLFMWLSKKYFAYDEDEKNANTPFTLDELAKLHEKGHLSDEEYKVLKQQIIDKISKE